MKLMINEIIKADEALQNQLLKHLVKKTLPEKVEICVLHRQLLHINRKKYKENSNAELSYCALIQAIQIAQKNEKILKEKSFGNLTLQEIEKLSKQQIAAFKASNIRRKTVREKLVPYLPYIISLRNQEMPFRQISIFLKEKYNLKASYSLIYQIFKELK